MATQCDVSDRGSSSFARGLLVKPSDSVVIGNTGNGPALQGAEDSTLIDHRIPPYMTQKKETTTNTNSLIKRLSPERESPRSFRQTDRDCDRRIRVRSRSQDHHPYKLQRYPLSIPKTLVSDSFVFFCRDKDVQQYMSITHHSLRRSTRRMRWTPPLAAADPRGTPCTALAPPRRYRCPVRTAGTARSGRG